MNENLKTLLKVGVSLSLFSLVIYFTGPSKIWNDLKGASLLHTLLAILLFAGVIQVLSAKKLQALLRSKGEELCYTSVLKYQYIGTFFNIFLPTTVGGDMVKAYKMSEDIKEKEEAYSSVFMQRFTGLIAVVSLALVSSLIYYRGIPREVLLLILIVFLPSIILSIFLIVRKSAVKKLSFIYRRLFNLFNFISLEEKARKLYNSINQFRNLKKTLIYVTGLSFVYHIILIFINFSLSKAVGMTVPLYYFFIFIPICAVLLFLPISIRGLGVREVLYASFFGQIGATSSNAVTMSFLFQITLIITSGIGGVIYLLTKVRTISSPDILNI